MNILAPSILAADCSRLGEELETIRSAGVQWVHIDVMDGVFVPSLSFGLPVVQSLRKVSDLYFDVHLMITDPLRYIHEFAQAGADSITFHLEAAEDPDEVIRSIRAEGKNVGISIKPGTPVEKVLPYLEKIDLLLIMTVEPGFGGQAYIEASTERIREAGRAIAVPSISKWTEGSTGKRSIRSWRQEPMSLSWVLPSLETILSIMRSGSSKNLARRTEHCR